MSVIVVVLGDLGRSPRMLYHALALADSGLDVELVGYLDTPLPMAIRKHRRIAAHGIGGSSAGATSTRRSRFLGGAVTRACRQGFALTRLLFWRLPAPDLILVQNPPGVPLLLVALLAARARRCRLVIDWHNLTSAMLALRLGASHRLVRAVEHFERIIGRCADAHLFVSRTMQQWLAVRWGLSGVVFRDRPWETFDILPPGERSKVRTALCTEHGIPTSEEALALIVSPTGWTVDEDFGLLLEAIPKLDAALASASRAAGHPRNVLFLVTGRGALRPAFEQRASSLATPRVQVRCAWLDGEEYPRVLGSADLGLCLHRSASGLDLPMKVADLFGAGVPVCALDYGPCLAEVIRHGHNGLLFRTADDLVARLAEVLTADASTAVGLQRLKEGVLAERTVRWRDAWERDARATLLLHVRAPNSNGAAP